MATEDDTSTKIELTVGTNDEDEKTNSIIDECLMPKKNTDSKSAGAKRKRDKSQPLGETSATDQTTSFKLRPQPKVISASDLAKTPVTSQSKQTYSGPQYREAPSVNLKFKDTIRVINKMLETDIISRYAVGGAVGATFYLEPVRTVDVDIFVPIHQKSGHLIVTLDPISDYLKMHGYAMKGEYWEIEGTLVQFMPIEGDELLLEAITKPLKLDVEGVPTFVFTAEYLAAIALKVGRIEKDVPRLLQFIREQKIDLTQFMEILKRHDLMDAWNRFKAKYLEDA